MKPSSITGDESMLPPESPHQSAIDWHEACRQRAIEVGDTKCVEFTKPLQAAMALEMLAAGTPGRQIAAKTKLDIHTIRALRWRHSETLETRRKEFSKKFAMGAEALVDLTFKKAEMLDDDDEMLANTSLKDLALGAAIMTDKAMALSGMATAVIEHRKGAV